MDRELAEALERKLQLESAKAVSGGEDEKAAVASASAPGRKTGKKHVHKFSINTRHCRSELDLLKSLIANHGWEVQNIKISY